MPIDSIHYQRGSLQILNQLELPQKSEYLDLKDTNDGWTAINKMQVRGSNAISIVGCLSLAVEISNKEFSSVEQLQTHIHSRFDYLVTARPTAENLLDAAQNLCQMTDELVRDGVDTKALLDIMLLQIESMRDSDVTSNKAIGRHGADDILQQHNNKPVRIMTHCNTGSLATAGYGTALGVIHALHEREKLNHVYFTETRPYNQGSRLTAYELVTENIPATLICDSAAATTMKQKNISAVVVGADRIVANGDTANKIGTYQLAIAAKYHGIPFYVAASSMSCDMLDKAGCDIPIEERSDTEITTIKGIRIAAEGVTCWNPAFDITPHELITGGIVTEFGLFKPPDLEVELKKCRQTLQR